jgi:hypothetical protein
MKIVVTMHMSQFHKICAVFQQELFLVSKGERYMRYTHYNICIIKRWQLHLTGNACELQQICVFQSRTHIFQIHSLSFPTTKWLFVDINMLLSVAKIITLHTSHCIFKNSLFLYIINYSPRSKICNNKLQI